MFKNICTKISLAVFSFLCLIPFVNSAHAAADTDLASGTATLLAYGADNKGLIIGFIVGVILIVLAIAMSKSAISWGMAKLVGTFGRRKKK